VHNWSTPRDLQSWIKKRFEPSRPRHPFTQSPDGFGRNVWPSVLASNTTTIGSNIAIRPNPPCRISNGKSQIANLRSEICHCEHSEQRPCGISNDKSHPVELSRGRNLPSRSSLILHGVTSEICFSERSEERVAHGISVLASAHYPAVLIHPI